MKQPHWYPAYIGIGSNLDSPAEQVRTATDLLGEIESCHLIVTSGLYQSPPLDGQDQPDYINAVAGVITQLQPLELLRALHNLESRQGRVRSGEKWESRVLDLDLLAYAGRTLQTDELTLPHPGITQRNFVLLPWQDISPHYVVPGLAAVADLARLLDDDEHTITKLD